MATPTEIKRQIQDMISAGKSEEEIGKFISEATSPHEPVKPKEYTGPTTFLGGVGKSLMSGEAPMAGLQGAGGFLKGATLDIPESIIGGINTLLHPIDAISNIPSGLKNIGNTFEKAGSDPEAFGRMMGQMTGQPLVTAGLAKAVPPSMQATGGLMRRYQPISGMIPGFLHARTLRNLERILGSGVENVGEKLGNISLGESRTSTPQSPLKLSTSTGAKVGFEPSPEIFQPESSTSTMRGFKEVKTPETVQTPKSTPTGTKVPEPTGQAQRLAKPTTTTSQTMEMQPKYGFKIVRGEDGYFYKVPKE